MTPVFFFQHEEPIEGSQIPMKIRQEHCCALMSCLTLIFLLPGCGGSVARDEDLVTDYATPPALSVEDWRALIAKTPMPKAGCFQASHPSTSWKEVPCVEAPGIPSPPPSVAPTPDSHPVDSPDNSDTPPAGGLRVQSLRPDGPTVNQWGDSNFMASVLENSALINQVIGSFPSVTGMTDEWNHYNEAGSYSLQINTNGFASECWGHSGTCNGRAGCTCWQQFDLRNHLDSVADNGIVTWLSRIHMQYWMIGYGPSCPSGGWKKHAGTDCYRDSGAVGVPGTDPTDLGNIQLIATAQKNGLDSVTLVTRNDAFGEAETDDQFYLAYEWNQAEFNVFGQRSGSDADFNAGTSLVVKTSVTSHTSEGNMVVTHPECLRQSTTAESNNLGLIGNCCRSGAHLADGLGTPAIRFLESNAANVSDPYCLYDSLNSPSGVAWEILPGAALDIGVGGDSTWIIGSNNDIFKWDPSVNNWAQAPGSGLRIAVHRYGTPWVVNSGGEIFQKNANTAAGGWTQHAGCAKDIGIGADGGVWIVGCSAVTGGYGMFKWNGSSWDMDASGGGGTRIAVDSTGRPWITNDRAELFQRTSSDPKSGGWTMYNVHAIDIGIGPKGYPWIIGSRLVWGGFNIQAWDDEVGAFRTVTGGATKISVGGDSRPWIVNSMGEIFRALN